MSNGKYQKPVSGRSSTSRRWNGSTSGGGSSACPTAAPYVRSVVWKDLNGGGPPSPAIRSEIEVALAAAVYVLLSCGRRVETSEQALAVVEKVYLSGDAAREIGDHLARGNAGAATAEGVEP